MKITLNKQQAKWYRSVLSSMGLDPRHYLQQNIFFDNTYTVLQNEHYLSVLPVENTSEIPFDKLVLVDHQRVKLSGIKVTLSKYKSFYVARHNCRWWLFAVDQDKIQKLTSLNNYQMTKLMNDDLFEEAYYRSLNE